MSLPQISTLFSRKERPYSGVELRPHFLLTELSLKGAGIGAFIGPCHVKTDHLVDWEDRLAQDRIEAVSMVHFIGEFFGTSLSEGVLIQRLFMAALADSLRARLPGSDPLRRDGDDLFWKDRKLSVSIMTASPVSVLMHAGINIDAGGAPVPAIGLSELGVDPWAWVPEALVLFQREWEDLLWACAKVRPVM